MRATMNHAAQAAPAYEAASQFFSPKNIPGWIERNSDVGGHYAPSVEKGEEWLWEGVTPYIIVRFPNSQLTITPDLIQVEGMRGSVEDCIIPLLIKFGVAYDTPYWDVETSTPDVPWWRRTTFYYEEANL